MLILLARLKSAWRLKGIGTEYLGSFMITKQTLGCSVAYCSNDITGSMCHDAFSLFCHSFVVNCKEIFPLFGLFLN